jgi:hypothetical protein
MKKLILTTVIALSTLVASAQVMFVTTYDGDQVENMDKITANMGIGYMVSDVFTLGAVRAGEDFEIFARYNLPMVDGMFAMIQVPTEDMSANLQVGAGMSFSVWRDLYLEPNYSMPAKSDANGKREGEFKIGIGYRF